MQAHLYTDSNNQSNFFSNSSSPNGSSARMDNINSANPRRRLVKEGWLNKRAEHMKTWRARYFVLYENGDFLGFRSKQDSASDKLNEPLNNFTVLNCQVLKTERPKANTFILRGIYRSDRLLWRLLTGRQLCPLDKRARFLSIGLVSLWIAKAAKLTVMLID